MRSAAASPARRIGILGLAFKANTDDMRDAPALTIVPQLIAGGAELRAYDPAAAHQARELLPQLQLADTHRGRGRAAPTPIVVLTEWSQFRAIAWRKLVPTMRRPLVIDLRNIYDAQDMPRQGLEYVPLGRRTAEHAYRAAAE